MKRLEIKRKYTTNESRRKYKFEYYIPFNTEVLQVCKKTFLNTTCLREYMVHSWVNKNDENDNISPSKEVDNENKAKREVPRLQLEKRLQFTQQFLANIPKLPSHCARATTKKTISRTSHKNFKLAVQAVLHRMRKRR